MAEVYSDNFTGDGAMSGRSLTGGATWVDADGLFSTTGGRATAGATDWVNWHTAHIDTDLASDEHYVQATTKFDAGSGSSARMCAVVWRRHATATTKTFYTAGIRDANNKTDIWKLIAGAFTSISATGGAPGTTAYVHYAESDSADQMTVKRDGATVYGPTTQSDITGHARTGLSENSQVGATAADFWDDFSTGTLDAAATRRRVRSVS